MTSSRLSGGKALGATGARSVLQASETVLVKAIAPEDDGSAITAEFIGDLHVGGLIRASQPQDQATAKDQGLRCGMSAGEGFQPLSFLKRHQNRRSKR